MVLAKILSKQTVRLDVSNVDKWTVIKALVDLIIQSGKSRDRQAILSAVIDREKRGSTGLEHGIAIPHARSESVSELVAALAVSKSGVDFDSADHKPCHLVFLIIAPPQESTRYLKALADVAFIGSEPARVAALTSAASPEEAISILQQMGGICPGNDATGGVRPVGRSSNSR